MPVEFYNPVSWRSPSTQGQEERPVPWITLISTTTNRRYAEVNHQLSGITGLRPAHGANDIRSFLEDRNVSTWMIAAVEQWLHPV